MTSRYSRLNANQSIGVQVPTAYLHLKAGTTTASTAPLKFTSGPPLSTPEAGAVEYQTDKYYATISTGLVRKQLAYKTLNNRVVVGTMGDYTTLKAAVDWFNASATENTEILVDGGVNLVAATIVVNNATYGLKIRGLGSSVTFLSATSALSSAPMFNFKSSCDITSLTMDGVSATGTCNGITYDTTAGVYSEITDIIIDTFAVGIADMIGVDTFVFNFIISNCTTGLLVDFSAVGGVARLIDAEIGNFVNCTTGINLAQGDLNDFALMHLIFLNAALSNGITYNGALFGLDTLSNIFNCTWNGVGTFITGFDFARTDGRDADVEVIGNVGTEDASPHAKVNVVNNTVTTTLTAANTYYKLNGVNSKVAVTFDLAATAGTYTITVGGQTTASINFNDTVATIKTRIEALTNVTTVTVVLVVTNKEWTIEFLTAGEGLVAMPVSYNIAGLTTTTSVLIEDSYYTVKFGMTNNRVTFLSSHERDVYMFITGNLSTAGTNRNVTVAIRKNGTGNAISPFTCRTITANIAYVFALNAYLDDVVLNDYFEIWVSSENAGDVARLWDLTWLINSR